MIDGFDVDAAETATRRQELFSRVREHAGQVARELAVVQGGDYGRATFRTEAGAWTLKYEGGDVAFLRFDPSSGAAIYVVSRKEPPEPAAFATAMADYDAFLEAFGEYVAGVEDVLDGVSTDFPAVASTADVAAERDRVLGRVRAVADAMAGELSRYDGEYGTFAATVDGTRWELKWDGTTASYLRVGGEGGTYLLSQYEPPSPRDVRRLAPEVAGFVAAFNDHVDDLAADLSQVSLSAD